MSQVQTVEETGSSAHAFDRDRERMHRQMLSSVSHDLKTPLASIIGSLEVFERMKDKLPEDKKGELVKVALQEAYRLDNFITNILDMAKLDNGLVQAKYEPTDVSIIVKDCLLRLNHRLRDTKVEMKNIEHLPATTDGGLLGRAICLVLDNAVKYGGNPCSISINYGRSTDQQGFVSIRDNGRGIPAAQLEAIFSKYTRFAKSDQQNAGTGLGLSISRAIMGLLKGDISAASYEGGGTDFTLHFPLA